MKTQLISQLCISETWTVDEKKRRVCVWMICSYENCFKIKMKLRMTLKDGGTIKLFNRVK